MTHPDLPANGETLVAITTPDGATFTYRVRTNTVTTDTDYHRDEADLLSRGYPTGPQWLSVTGELVLDNEGVYGRMNIPTNKDRP